jgi:hypothetical protein
MNINELYPSAYIKAQDVETPKLVTINSLEVNRKMNDGEHKHVLSFAEIEQELVLNKTNTGLIASIHGQNTQDWVGKQIVLFKDKTSLQGKVVDCVRVRAPKQKTAPAPAKPAAAKPAPVPAQADNTPDDVPF